MAQKSLWFHIMVIYLFVYNYSKFLRPHKNTEQCLEKFLPTQDGREHDSCDAWLILGLNLFILAGKYLTQTKQI